MPAMPSLYTRLLIPGGDIDLMNGSHQNYNKVLEFNSTVTASVFVVTTMPFADQYQICIPMN
jgi:hypothetical protein